MAIDADNVRIIDGEAWIKLNLKRKSLPDVRDSWTYKDVIHAREGNVDVYTTISPREGPAKEVFCTIGKTGTRERALLDNWAIAVSILMQCGLLDVVINKFRGQRFEPSGRINVFEKIKDAQGEIHKRNVLVSSPIDLVVRRLEKIKNDTDNK